MPERRRLADASTNQKALRDLMDALERMVQQVLPNCGSGLPPVIYRSDSLSLAVTSETTAIGFNNMVLSTPADSAGKVAQVGSLGQ